MDSHSPRRFSVFSVTDSEPEKSVKQNITNHKHFNQMLLVHLIGTVSESFTTTMANIISLGIKATNIN